MRFTSFGRARGGHRANGTESPPAAVQAPDALTAMNPWVAAVRDGRREWAGAFGDLARSRRNWQLVAFAALGIAAVESTGLVALATRSHITPYVVEVDRLGRAQAFGRADRVEAADRRVVVSQIATWIRDIRAVLADPIAQQDLVRRAYAFVDQGTAQFLQAYMTDPARDPRVIGRELTRVIEVMSILPVPGATDSRARRGTPLAPVTWKVAWTETDYPRAGGTPTVTAWEAYVTTRQVPATTPERVEANPLGLYITAVSWTQVSARQSVDGAPGGVRGSATALPLFSPAITSPPLVVDPNAPTRQEPVSSPGTAQPTGVTP